MSQRPGDLNNRQRAFCEAYALHGDAKRAMLEAGYSERVASTTQRKLLDDPDIQAYLTELRQPMKDAMHQAYLDKADVVREQVLSSIEKQVILSKIARGEITESMMYRGEWVPGLTKISDRISAIKLLAQMHGDLDPHQSTDNRLTIIWPESLRDKDAD